MICCARGVGITGGSVGTEPGSDPFLGMVGVHYEISKLGSNTEIIK